MRDDEIAALHALRQWHNGQALSAVRKAMDRRASRYTAEEHRTNASFHQRAVYTLDAAIKATGSEQ